MLQGYFHHRNLPKVLPFPILLGLRVINHIDLIVIVRIIERFFLIVKTSARLNDF